MPGEPYIPNYITVHLGTPRSNAQNVTLPFPDYIKNVASSEIYPTWPENAIRANIYAQISFALNRFYTEWYPSQGYDFDITNSTAYDQAFVPNREIYENISRIVDEIFNQYIAREGFVEPYFAQYCNGTTTTCPGLSQWGTVPLAEEGLTPFEILTRYYGDDIRLVSAPVRNASRSYPGYTLQLGSAGNDVQLKQIQLNRISRNYPAIPKIDTPDGIFGQETDDAVRAFQRIFGLTVDGVIGPATWNRMTYLYNGIKRLSELDSEGLALSELPSQFETLLYEGLSGNSVRVMQYFLAVVGQFYETVPPIEVTGTFDAATREAVVAFQNTFGLDPDGIVGRMTWNDLYRAYRGIVAQGNVLAGGVALFPGNVLRIGSQGAAVSTLQEYLSYLSGTFEEISDVPVTGVFGNQTQAAVTAFQTLFDLTPNGIVGPITWDAIAGLYSDLMTGNTRQAGQFGGTELAEEGVSLDETT